jgi:hypothetical protein
MGKQTGPISDEGKARSSMNALKGGYTSKRLLIPGEYAHEWRSHMRSVMESYPITTPAQQSIVEEIAQNLWQQKRLRRLVEQEVSTVSHEPIKRLDIEMSLGRACDFQVSETLPLTSFSYVITVDEGMQAYLYQEKILKAIELWEAYLRNEDVLASELIDLMPTEVREVFDEQAKQKGVLIDDYLESTLPAQEIELITVQLRVIKRHAKDYLHHHPDDEAKVMHWQSAIATRVYEVYNQVSYQRSLATVARSLTRCIEHYRQLSTMHIDQLPVKNLTKKNCQKIDVTDVGMSY